MAVVVVVIAGPAAHFGGFATHQRYDGMIRQTAAFDAEVVKDVAEAQFTHTNGEYTTMQRLMSLAALLASERNVFARLTTPARIQRFLDDGLGYNLEPKGDTCYSPRLVLKHHVAHCMEGALVAAMALRFLGHPPLLVDLEAVRDSDHVLAVYRIGGLWGALAKSDYSGLRSREPVYRTIRELVMSYFEHYYNPAGEKTLRAYSRPVTLARFDSCGWMTAERDVWEIPNHLCDIAHTPVFPANRGRLLAPMDRRLYKAGRLGGAAH